MTTHTERSSETKSAATSADQQHHSLPAATFADQRTGTAAQLKLQELADNSPQVQRHQAIQLMADTSAVTTPVAQLIQMSEEDMTAAGFRDMSNAGHAGSEQRWQYDEQGYHVSAIRKANTHVREFHVVGRWAGNIENRIDYKERKGNNWVETKAVFGKNDEGEAATMRDIAARIIPSFKHAVAPAFEETGPAPAPVAAADPEPAPAEPEAAENAPLSKAAKRRARRKRAEAGAPTLL